MTVSMIKYFLSILFFCIPSIVFGASSQLSISPSEASIDIRAEDRMNGAFRVQRQDASTTDRYTVSMTVDAALTEVTIEAEDMVFTQGETEVIYPYAVVCARACAGTGTVVITLTPVLSDADDQAGLVAQLAIAHKVRVRVITEQDVPTVEAASVTGLDDLLVVEKVVQNHHFIAPDSTVEAIIRIKNNGTEHIAHLPYAVTVYRDDQLISSSTGVASEVMMAGATSSIRWSTEVSERATYRYVVTIAGEEAEFVVYVSHVQSILFWAILLLVSAAVLWIIRPWVRSLAWKRRMTDTPRRRLYVVLGSIVGIGLLAVYFFFFAPRIREDDALALASPEQFLLVHDLGKYTLVRITDGKTDFLNGDWRLFVAKDSTVYAAPEATSPNTEQRYFYRILSTGAQRFAADIFPGQITMIAENTPGTYAIASGERFVCIFSLVAPDGPDCQRMESIGDDEYAVQAEWMDDAGQYAAVRVRSASGIERTMRYDAWNASGNELITHIFSTPAPAEALSFVDADVVMPSAGVMLNNQFFFAPWNTNTARVNADVFAGILRSAHEDTLILLNAEGRYRSVLPVSPDARIYILRKGTVITKPLM